MKTDGEFYESVMKKSRKRAAGRFCSVMMTMLVVCILSAVFTFAPSRVNDVADGGINTVVTDALPSDETGNISPGDGSGLIITTTGKNNPYNNTDKNGVHVVRIMPGKLFIIFLPTLAVCAVISAAAFVRWKKINERGNKK